MTESEKQFIIYLTRNVANIISVIAESYRGTPLEYGWKNDAKELLKRLEEMIGGKK